MDASDTRGFVSLSRARNARVPLTRRPSDRSPTRSLGSTRAAGTKLKPLRYYNSAVHGAAFVLPEFARAAVEPFVVPGSGFS